jgi:hypothetical protein
MGAFRQDSRIAPADRHIREACADLMQVQYLRDNDIAVSPKAIHRFERRAFARLMQRILELPDPDQERKDDDRNSNA